jgi:hypothetical protein
MTMEPVELTEEQIPLQEIEAGVEELVELYGGEISDATGQTRRFTLPMRRGVATSGGVECTLTWEAMAAESGSDDGPVHSDSSGVIGTLRLRCDRNVDAPKAQRVLLLVAGVAGALMFMLWPFYPGEREFGTVAWLGGLIALAVYFMTLRRTSGGIAADFLRRLATRQRARLTEVDEG